MVESSDALFPLHIPQYAAGDPKQTAVGLEILSIDGKRPARRLPFEYYDDHALLTAEIRDLPSMITHFSRYEEIV